MVEREKSKFPDKKDMWYWILILILFIIGSFTYYYGSNKNVISHIGFGGTIVSILLALIAIIYSFYQSSTYENAIHKLDSSAKKIEESTTKLSHVSEIEIMMREFKEEVSSLQENLNVVKDTVGKVDDGITLMKQTFGENISVNSPSNGNFEEIFTQEYLDNFVQTTSKISLLLLLEAKNACEEGREMVLDKITKRFIKYVNKNDNPDEVSVQRFVNAAIGMISVYKQLGFFQISERTLNTCKIEKINSKLLKSIVNVENEISQDPSDELYTLVIAQKNK
jgi:hypothetical protein